MAKKTESKAAGGNGGSVLRTTLITAGATLVGGVLVALIQNLDKLERFFGAAEYTVLVKDHIAYSVVDNSDVALDPRHSVFGISLDGERVGTFALDKQWPEVAAKLRAGTHTLEFAGDVLTTQGRLTQNCVAKFEVAGEQVFRPLIVLMNTGSQPRIHSCHVVGYSEEFWPRTTSGRIEAACNKEAEIQDLASVTASELTKKQECVQRRFNGLRRNS